MPELAHLLAPAGVLALVGLALAAAARLLHLRGSLAAAPRRALLAAGFVAALCGIALAAVAGTLAFGEQVGWF